MALCASCGRLGFERVLDDGPTADGDPGDTSGSTCPDAGITVDGVLDDAAWVNVAPQTVTKLVLGQSSFGVVPSFVTRWDAQYFYLGAHVIDASVVRDGIGDLNTENDDSVELYLDMQRNRSTTYQADDFHWIVVSDGSAIHEVQARTSGVLFAGSLTPDGYAVEMAVPWSLLGVSPTPGAVFGFDVGTNIDQNGGPRDAQLMWNGTSVNFLDTSAFGDVAISAGCVADARTVP